MGKGSSDSKGSKALVPVSPGPRGRSRASVVSAVVVPRRQASPAPVMVRAAARPAAPRCPGCGRRLGLDARSLASIGPVSINICSNCASAGQQLVTVLARIFGQPRRGGTR